MLKKNFSKILFIIKKIKFVEYLKLYFTQVKSKKMIKFLSRRFNSYFTYDQYNKKFELKFPKNITKKKYYNEIDLFERQIKYIALPTKSWVDKQIEQLQPYLDFFFGISHYEQEVYEDLPKEQWEEVKKMGLAWKRNKGLPYPFRLFGFPIKLYCKIISFYEIIFSSKYKYRNLMWQNYKSLRKEFINLDNLYLPKSTKIDNGVIKNYKKTYSKNEIKDYIKKSKNFLKSKKLPTLPSPYDESIVKRYGRDGIDRNKIDSNLGEAYRNILFIPNKNGLNTEIIDLQKPKEILKLSSEENVFQFLKSLNIDNLKSIFFSTTKKVSISKIFMVLNSYYLYNTLYNSNWNESKLYLFLSSEKFKELSLWNKNRGKFVKETNYLLRVFFNLDSIYDYVKLIFNIKDFKSTDIVLRIYKVIEIFHGAGIHFLVPIFQRKNFVSTFWIQSLSKNFEQRYIKQKKLLRRKKYLEFLMLILGPIDLFLNSTIRFIEVFSLLLTTLDQINKTLIFQYYAIKFSNTIKNFKSIKISRITKLPFFRNKMVKFLFVPFISEKTIKKLKNYFSSKWQFVLSVRKKYPIFEIVFLRIFSLLNIPTKLQEICTYFFVIRNFSALSVKLTIYIIIYYLQNIISNKQEIIKREIDFLKDINKIFELLDKSPKIETFKEYFSSFSRLFKNFQNYKTLIFDLIFERNLSKNEIDSILELPIY